MYPGYLSECVIRFAFWALYRVYNIENALLVCPYAPVLFAAVAEPSLAKEVLALVKSDADVNLKPCFDGYFLRKYYVHHFVFDLRLREILVFLGPCFCAYFYFIEAFLKKFGDGKLNEIRDTGARVEVFEGFIDKFDHLLEN